MEEKIVKTLTSVFVVLSGSLIVKGVLEYSETLLEARLHHGYLIVGLCVAVLVAVWHVYRDDNLKKQFDKKTVELWRLDSEHQVTLKLLDETIEENKKLQKSLKIKPTTSKSFSQVIKERS